jgi:AcrR family transcriptional regulator
VIGETSTGWRDERRQAAIARILETAWQLSREHGLAGLSLREVARRLGMASPSLYGYFASKDALYDAMFAQGYREYLALPRPETSELRDRLKQGARRFVGFCVADPVRYQLLFQRTIPGFTPSPRSYALAVEAYDRDLSQLAGSAALDQADLDLLTAVMGGIVAQQVANEPGGSRWTDLVERAADMLADEFERAARPARRRTAATRRRTPAAPRRTT